MIKVLMIGIGGFTGSSLRFLISEWTKKILPYSKFPLGTLAVNIIGCFLIGFLIGFMDTKQTFSIELRLLLLTGLLGGFTTFSAFGHESLVLFQQANISKALLNISLNVGLGLTAVWLGNTLAKTTNF
jgi:fluoride exporter